MQVFKDTERYASGLMAHVRADARQRYGIKSTGQYEFFGVQEHGAGDDQYIAALRQRHMQRAQELVRETLSQQKMKPIPSNRFGLWRAVFRWMGKRFTPVDTRLEAIMQA